jgi:hypothetical protein
MGGIVHGAKIVAVNVLVFISLFLASETIYRTCCTDIRPDWFRAARDGHAVRTFPGENDNRTSFWAREDPDLGWVLDGRKFPNIVNLEGMRAQMDYSTVLPKGNGVKRIMVIGDSFIFGSGLDYADTLPGILQKSLGSRYEVYNVASPAWGLDQMYLAYKKFVDRIDPDTVILVYIDDDLWRVFESFRIPEGLNKPSFKLKNGELISRDGDQSGFLEWLARNSMILNRLYNGIYRKWECKRISVALFEKFVDETRFRSEQLLVLRYPYKQELLENRREIDFDLKGFFSTRDILYIDPYNDMPGAGKRRYTKFYTNDDHPAKEGNKFVGDLILRTGL